MGHPTGWRGQVWDDDRVRGAALVRAVVSWGGSARLVQRLSADDSPCELTVVGLPCERAFEPETVAVLHRLRRSGGRVIGIGPGLEAAPIGALSRYYLAGFGRLLDSECPDALAGLEGIVATFVEAQRARSAELEVAQRVMHRFGLIGQSNVMLDLVCKAIRIGRVPELPVLIEGETGTGKERLARIVHAHDPTRVARPLLAVNCAALSPSLAESELFGHVRGAFTGAHEERKGLFRAADGGVLLLDEIGDLPLPLQTKLLRVLQERRVLAVGSDREVPVDVRVVSATSRKLAQLVAAGSFRADLLHRLDVLSLTVPPLRDREGDLAELVHHFAARHPAGVTVPIAAGFITALAQLKFPGNVRELQNLVQKALVERDDASAPLEPADLPSEVWQELESTAALAPAAPRPELSPSTFPRPASGVLRDSLAKTMRGYERALLERTLAETNGNQTLMADRLRITPRSVYNKLRKHGLTPRPRTRETG